MKPIQLLIFAVLKRVIALVCAPIVCLFARWDDRPTTFTGGLLNNGPLTVRGDLPWWAAWFETFDERLPGGMYEPTVRAVYDRFGRYWCSVYWLNRNAMFGMTKAIFGRPTTRDEILRYEWRTVGPVRIGWGWKRYRATPTAHWIDGPFVKILSATVRRNVD